MRDYAKSRSRFWTRGTGKRLPRLAKLVAQNLISCHSGNMIGLYYLPVALIADDCEMSREETLEALAKCVAEGFCKYDHETSCVWVVNAAREQMLGDDEECLSPTDHRVRGVEKLLKGLRDHPFYEDFVSHYKDILCIGGYIPPEQAGRPRKGQAKSPASPSRAPLEPVSSKQGTESRDLPATQETQSAPAARVVLVPEPELVAPAAAPVSATADFEVRESFRSAFGAGEMPKLYGNKLRAAVDHCVGISRRYGKPLGEVAQEVCRAAGPGTASWDFNVAKVDPYAPPPAAPAPIRKGRLVPTMGTSGKDFEDAPSAEQQLAAVRAERAARSANGT